METIREPFGDRVFNVVNYVVLSLFFIIVLYPLIYIVSASFSSSEAVVSGRVWLWPLNLLWMGIGQCSVIKKLRLDSGTRFFTPFLEH